MSGSLEQRVLASRTLVKLLPEKGADVEPKDIECGRTPLSWVAAGKYEVVVKLLLKRGGAT